MINHVITFEQMEFGMLRRICQCLGISFIELLDVSPTLTPVYVMQNYISGYALTFRDDAPVEILKKIKKLLPCNTAFLGFYLVNDLLPISAMKN